MAYRRLITVAIVLILVTACGRRLPEEGEIIETDTTEQESAVVASPTVEDVSEDATEAAEVVEATAEAVTDGEEATEETVAVAVAEPTDELIAIIADASASNGETLFNQLNDTGFACATCHNANDEQRLVGPGFAGLPMRAEERIEGTVAERYLYNSIIHPNDYIVESYPEAVMPAVYEEIYNEDELHDLVAYLMTLGEMPDRSAPAVVAATEAPTEETEAVADSATEEPTTQETVVAEASPDTETDETVETEPNTIVITQIVVVTATPMAETDVDTDVAVVSTPDPNATPDFVVTLSSFGRVSNGEILYADQCLECHTLDGSGEADLSDLTALAGGVAPERYLFDALNAPDVHEVIYTDTLSDVELYDLIAYLIAETSE